MKIGLKIEEGQMAFCAYYTNWNSRMRNDNDRICSLVLLAILQNDRG